MNTLEIQQYEEQIAILQAKVKRLEDEDRRQSHPSLYVCTRCGLFYQSPWGCGCVRAVVAPRDAEVEREGNHGRAKEGGTL